MIRLSEISVFTLFLALFSLTVACGHEEDPNPDGTETDDVTGDDDDDDDDDAFCPGDELAPWAGGSSYYSQWTNGPSDDPTHFPIAVWLQAPRNAAAYADIGVNTFIGLWDGPTDDQLDELAAEDMPAICSQNDLGLSRVDDPTVIAWSQQDEPDNAQSDGNGGWGPCVDPSDVQALGDQMRQADSTRPVYLNLGQGVANDEWVGRGVCTDQDDDYPDYIVGADIISYDIYPVTSTGENLAGNLWFVATGVERLREWANYEKPVWNWLETTHINNPDVRPTPDQVRTEVWMSLIAGSMGIGYFCHEFAPGFIEAGLLSYDDITAEVGEINAQINELAPVLNSQTVSNGVTVSSSNPDVPVAVMLKRYADATYLFAVAMRDDATSVELTFTCIPPGASAEVLGEDRSVALTDRTLADEFSGYEVHLYRIPH